MSAILVTHSRKENNGNELVLSIPKNSRAGFCPSDGVVLHERYGWDVSALYKDAVGVFYCWSPQGECTIYIFTQPLHHEQDVIQADF